MKVPEDLPEDWEAQADNDARWGMAMSFITHIIELMHANPALTQADLRPSVCD